MLGRTGSGSYKSLTRAGEYITIFTLDFHPKDVILLITRQFGDDMKIVIN